MLGWHILRDGASRLLRMRGTAFETDLKAIARHTITNFDQRGQSVLNQYNAETINVLTVQSERLSRIRWRKLETVDYCVLNNSKVYLQWFTDDVFKALDEAFSGKGYRRFTALFYPKPINRDQHTFFCYIFYCHEIGFATAVRRMGKERLQLAERLRGVPSDERTKVITDLDNEDKTFFGLWRTSVSIDVSQFGAIEFEYDPDGRTMSIKSKEKLTLDPVEYEHHVETTSEVLLYVARVERGGVLLMGDPRFTLTLKTWPLLKLATCIIDGDPINTDAIKINANDYEQWDYHNPKLEAELAHYRR